MPKGKSANAKFFTKTKEIFKKKRKPAAAVASVRLLHDNASSHKASILYSLTLRIFKCFRVFTSLVCHQTTAEQPCRADNWNTFDWSRGGGNVT